MHEGKTIEQLGAMVSRATAKHTPGPWFYEGPDKGDSSVGMAATQGYIYVEVMDGTTEVVLATIHEPMYVDGGLIDEENFDPGERYIGSELANGPMFAAAPDMLAALKAIQQVFFANGEGIFRGKLAHQIHAAINKAGGAQ